LYAGDAAAVVDPLTGEGIAQALESGMLAADAIADAAQSKADIDAVADRYRDTVDRALGRDLRFAHALQRILASPRGARGAIKAAGWSDWTRRSFARWLFEGYPRAVLHTPDRWHRHRFTEPGAFCQTPATS
jgi:flavin-dependent dehydrogenase